MHNFLDMNQFEAASSGNIAWFEYHKTNGTLPDLTEHSNAAVRYASSNNKLEILKWLVLSSGQSVDVTAHEDEAFLDAVYFGFNDVVRWLILESKQPINVRKRIDSAIEYASEQNHREILKFLEIIASLLQSGKNLDDLQTFPEIVSVAESGVEIKTIEKLSTEDIQHIDRTCKSRRSSKRL